MGTSKRLVDVKPLNPVIIIKNIKTKLIYQI